MKAVVCNKYGTPSVLQLTEVETPAPKDDEVRIKIHAASVGPADCAFRQGLLMVKLYSGWRRPKHPILGAELAGVIDAVGKNVNSYDVGDQVFGLSAGTFGAHAEYKCLPAGDPFVALSSKMSFEEAVAICDGAPTSLSFLRDKAKLQPGQKVLINGASGAVGVYAVQLAKHYGAVVTGVCSGANVDLVKSLGADHVVDYTKEDFTASGERYDVIFDAVGKRSFKECKASLTQRGIYLSTVPTLSIVLQMLWTSMTAGKKAVFATAGFMQNKDNLEFLRELYDTGKVKPVIDRRYSLEQLVEAHDYVEQGRKKGNVIVTVNHSAS